MAIATEALLGQGLALKSGNGASPQVFTTVAQVSNISGFGATAPLVRTTHYQSTAEEYIAGLPDGSEIQATANYLPNNAVQLALIADFNNKTLRDFRLVLPPTASPYGTFSFAGKVTKWEITPPVDDRMSINFTVKITGAISYA